MGSGFVLTLYCDPVPASRPRVTRYATYYPKRYKAYKDGADKAIPTSPRPMLQGNLRATIEFVCERPKTTKRSNPRGDIDNHMKSILDAVTGTRKNPKFYWKDDDQITQVIATKRWPNGNEEPHTRIQVEQL